MLDKKPNQPSKYKTNNWVEIHDVSHGVHGTGSQIKFKTLMLRSSLCNYSDACILGKETIIVPKTAAAGANPENGNKKVIFKNCAPFPDCINEINNT